MRRCLTYASTFAGLFLASAAWGQIGAPLLGYVPDGAVIRPVSGIPAAAAVAPGLDLKQNFARMTASPAHDYVLVTAQDAGTVSVYTPALGLTPLIGAGIAPQMVVTSPRGSAAVLWFSPLNHAQLVTGLPNAPAIRPINAAFLRTPPSSVAISDDGNWLAVSTSAGLYLWGPVGQMNRLPVTEQVYAMAFFQGSADLAVAIPHQVIALKAATGYNTPYLLYDEGDYDPDVAALALSPDNASVILADRSGWIVSIDAASGTATKVACGCRPEGLFGLGQSAFRVTGLANGAFQLFDTVHKEVLFAPLALDPGATP